jgi:squalene cyclase
MIAIATQTAVGRGIEFLCRNQYADGSWSDWALPPGESRAWTTAYVGWKLGTLPRELAPARALDRAASWLAGAGFADGGWGYGPGTGPDADSTALALLFLGGQGQRLRSAMPVLLSHQQSDGGFATYTRAWNHGAWTLSQPEVTATVMLALLDDPGAHEPVAAAARYLRAHRRPDGLWPSYWWTSPLYATDVALAGLGDDTTVTPHRVAAAVRAEVTATAFDLALQVSCLRRLGDTAAASAAAAELTARQLADGSWPCGPVLRLTHRHVTEPWHAADPGPLFADEHRLFATATAVAALAGSRDA